MTVFLFTIMILYLFYDLKYRRIPNFHFFLFLLVGTLLSLVELMDNFNQSRVIIMNKVVFFIFSLIAIIFLFQIKIFGGADCKFLILIFLYSPYTGLSYNFYLFFYFFFLLFYFGLISILNFINRVKKSNPSFAIIFELYNIQNTLKKIFVRTYFIFKDFVVLNTLNKNKYYIASSDLVFNYSSFKLQVLFQYRAPLIPLIILAYTLCSFTISN